MLRDPWLIDQLSKAPTETFAGDVFRATRRNLEPTTPSTSGGRWAQPDGPAVLYTSLAREGALAEIAYHWGQFTPRPTKPALIHRLGVKSERTLRLVRSDLESLGVEQAHYRDPNYHRTQQIGAVVAFIGCDGLLVPSARWDCSNLVFFMDNISMDVDFEIKSSEEINWYAWAKANNLLD